ncbi:MAG: c-type cytochrome [Bacteroidia bacterium]|nr:c-type cytochrome [Bacteroidia bacterium]
MRYFAKANKWLIILGGIALFGLFLISAMVKPPVSISGSDNVHDVLAQLGKKETANLAGTSLSNVSIDAGRKMALEGISIDGKGKRYPKLGNHFVCTSCHNIVKESDDLNNIDPKVRLEYAVRQNLPFLQGSPLYGLVNRTTFYNGDYIKKYGDLASKAHNSIRESIQLCAIECSQGRRLRPWEIESILAYLWTLQLKIEDLNLSEDELREIGKAINDKENIEEAIALIESRYRKDSPATFGTPPPDLRKGYDLKGNPDNGKMIFELGCLHCHQGQRYSFLELDNSNFTFKYLRKHLKRHNRFSFYWVSRYGTQPRPGKKAYMPQYTKEKMSDQQLEDLRAYIDKMAE